MSKELFLTCWGGVGSVTGANFLVESRSTRFLVDCGLLQGVVEADMENSSPFQYAPEHIDFLFITHAHMDHIGRVPRLCKYGFQGIIYSTPETKDLARIMLSDALRVMEQHAKETHTQALYDQVDLDHALSYWRTIPYHTHTVINDEFSVYLKDAGHILGSSMFEFMYNGKKIVFTGDSGNSPTPLLKDTEYITDAHYMIMDSVYGDREHDPKEIRDAAFKESILRTINGKGTVLIPAFSLERTQVILYMLNNLIEDKKIPPIPVFLDSPLALKVTDVYKRMQKDFNTGVQKEIAEGDDVFSFPTLTVVRTRQESNRLAETEGPKIIIAGSGMSSGGRIVGHEMRMLGNPRNTLLLLGYQAIGTLGRMIQEAGTGGSVNIEGVRVQIQARVETISGFSSHKDSSHLLEMVAHTKDTVQQVFVVMGEPKASLFLVQRLRDYVGVNALYPKRGERYTLVC